MYSDTTAAASVAGVQGSHGPSTATPASQSIEQVGTGQTSEFKEIFNETQRISAMSYTEFLDLAPQLSATTKKLFSRLINLDAQAASLSAEAQKVSAADQPVAPSELVMLSMKSHEFMFHAQLTSGMANRTADGLQQLFRQQS